MHLYNSNVQQLNALLQQQETVTVLKSERECLARQVQNLTSTPSQCVRAGVVDTQVMGKPDELRRRFDEVRGLVVQTEIVPRSRGSAVYQEELTKTEASSTPRLNATLDSEESALSTQMYNILVMTTTGAALDKCHNAGVNEGFEAWRPDEVCGTPDERAERRHSNRVGCVRGQYTTTRTNPQRK